MAKIILDQEEAATLIAFLDSFDLALTGAWAPVSDMMRDSYGIEDPEAAIENARAALEGEVR